MTSKPWRVDGYEEIRELGAGAASRVVLARHVASGRPVAIKYLYTRGLDDLTNARREAQILASIDSPYVAGLREYVESADGAAIIMDQIEGVSLRALLQREGTLTPEAALAVLKASLLGLAAAHAAGVVHRDFKPANVLVQPDGSSRLIDFGISALIGERSVAGTPLYMSPERWQGAPATPADDVYAATCVFYECLTGERPYDGMDYHSLRSEHCTADIPLARVPEALRPLVTRGLAKSAHERQPTVVEFLAELETAAASAYGRDWEYASTLSRRVLAAALVLLPRIERPRWQEEWMEQLSELPTRRARASWTLSLIAGMPHMAFAVRRAGRPA